MARSFTKGLTQHLRRLGLRALASGSYELAVKDGTRSDLFTLAWRERHGHRIDLPSPDPFTLHLHAVVALRDKKGRWLSVQEVRDVMAARHTLPYQSVVRRFGTSRHAPRRCPGWSATR